jgi:lipoprotein-anchoring transpeptidase ErfK/SrfK
LLVLSSVHAAPQGSAAVSERERDLRRSVAWQVALDGVGISPGIIDGKVGPKTHFATREFQRVRGLKMTGELDSPTAEALKVDPDNVFVRYTLQKSDFNEIGDVPSSWKARAKLQKLGHAAIENVIGERFHCHTSLLTAINPSVRFAALKPGDEVVVPRVIEPPAPVKAASIEVNLSDKTIRVIDRDKQIAALFHCSVAASKAKLPKRDASVTAVAMNPTYTYDPDMWPEVKEKVNAKLTIPPGPRNPVGRCWISLSLPGYGMHGTPNPELIGKTGSHGCFRLTNWDALRLAKMVESGTPVRFTGHPDELARN